MIDKNNKINNTTVVKSPKNIVVEDKKLTPQDVAKLTLESLNTYKKSFEYLKDK